ncbi:D-arabinono-1,4-lactone oxidase [Cryptococcus deuterogattii 99/473]|uniref:D-arabinono-1,4-lactone oxidase n=1 Tax=Cryptococcus deuterogattii Ram5 TaxID=1296110 RepID=A0A0D0V0K9_9TREE|nr:D-arabinono-1,4-lactone oxidase [Cryptococcus deuterogattii LA55]KIR38445.1 D-arabinono-1,4-lactone oxidase [Cryptococcus deuterogattii Ram5]KIR90364.1 D-arabinono-1,4-lactone oxidase [Cryptococcus deuterogattii CBS 10090]KIY55064.1 D-arabinono-1,4-lactone oxidase [Cryptococcus deuterogattii 99/473]
MEDLTAVDNQALQAALHPISVSSTSPLATFSNWAKTFTCKPQRVFVPTTILQCRQILELARREGARVHPVGVGHSPSDLACTNGWLVRMEGVRGTVKIDNEQHTATFLAGTTLHEIHASLASSNPPLAIPNIGSISDQTIAGLISTASHGSGVTFPVLSAHVKSLLLALPLPGTPLVRVSQNQDEELFKASLCGLGTTGLILEVEFEVEDAFRLRETKEGKAIEEVLESLDEIEKSAEHVRVWWYPDGKGAVVGRANRTYDPAQPTSDLVGHILGYHVTQFFLYVARIFPSLTSLVGRWAWWLSKEDSVRVDDGYKVLNFDCLFPQYALEWAIDAKEAKSCLQEMKKWLDREAADPAGLRVHFPIEIRWSCSDDIWLSPSYGRDTCWIGVVTYRPYGLSVPYREFQDKFSSLLQSYGGRPHWAKQHVLGPKTLEVIYPKFKDFQQVLRRVDPNGVLLSENVRRHVEGENIPHRMFERR